MAEPFYSCQVLGEHFQHLEQAFAEAVLGSAIQDYYTLQLKLSWPNLIRLIARAQLLLPLPCRASFEVRGGVARGSRVRHTFLESNMA
jgi:hypothetical protein